MDTSARYNSNPLTRRALLSGGAAAAGLFLSNCGGGSKPQQTSESANSTAKADVTLRIGPVLVDIAKEHTISTIGYNGSVPGPLIRLKEGAPVTVDLFNDTDSAELVHWHGQIIPPEVDGAAEEKSLAVPARGHIRYQLTPQPSGTRFVHTHVMPMADLSRGTYTGQFAFVYIEPKTNPGRYDQEVFLATHEWEPFFGAEEMEEDEPGDEKEKAEHKDEKRMDGRSAISVSRSMESVWAMASPSASRRDSGFSCIF